MCSFWLKLVYIYEISVTSNFKFEFCNRTYCNCWDVTLGTISAKFTLKRWTLSTAKLSYKRNKVRELSMDGQESSKLVSVGRKQHKQLERWSVTNDSIHRSVRASFICSRRFCHTATSFALRFRSSHISTLMCQFYAAQLPVFFTKFGNNRLEGNIM